MRPIGIVTILCALVPAAAYADQMPKKPAEPAPPAARSWPNRADLVAPGVLRQDLFDRTNPGNLRHDYPAPPAQPGH